jgi:hypothetical protein
MLTPGRSAPHGIGARDCRRQNAANGGRQWAPCDPPYVTVDPGSRPSRSEFARLEPAGVGQVRRARPGSVGDLAASDDVWPPIRHRQPRTGAWRHRPHDLDPAFGRPEPLALELALRVRRCAAKSVGNEAPSLDGEARRRRPLRSSRRGHRRMAWSARRPTPPCRRPSPELRVRRSRRPALSGDPPRVRPVQQPTTAINGSSYDRSHDV